MSSQTSSSRSPSPSTETPTPHHALELVDILEEIFSHLGSPRELLQYRLVCQQWNDLIVHTLVRKWKNSFPLRLRYGPQVPLSLLKCDAERWTREILESPPMIVLNGTATPFSFDTVVIDRDFYLAGVNPEWQHFLEIYGEPIRHLKFNIRSGEAPQDNSHHVSDCAEVVSMENLRAAFSAIPNLESLDFSIRFTDYGALEPGWVPQRMFPESRKVTDFPQLKKLTKVTIQEPHAHGIQYIYSFLKEILGMAPNLTTLYIKYSRDLKKFASALRSLHHLNNSLTALGITMMNHFSVFNIQESGFSRFHLTKLELNCISGNVRHLEEFLQSQSSTLVTLILGDRVTPKLEPGTYHCRIPRPWGTQIHKCMPLYDTPLGLPPRMDSLKILEVNLTKFPLEPITDYRNQFPSLEELTFGNCEETGCVWTYQQLNHVIRGDNGPSHTLKTFSLLGQMPGGSNGMNINEDVRSTFPFAEHHFGL